MNQALPKTLLRKQHFHKLLYREHRVFIRWEGEAPAEPFDPGPMPELGPAYDRISGLGRIRSC